MRRAYNNKISILLIIIIAIFTILSYFFDQLVIRNEDKLRNAEISFNNSTQKIIKLNSILNQLQAAYDYSDQKLVYFLRYRNYWLKNILLITEYDQYPYLTDDEMKKLYNFYSDEPNYIPRLIKTRFVGHYKNIVTSINNLEEKLYNIHGWNLDLFPQYSSIQDGEKFYNFQTISYYEIFKNNIDQFVETDFESLSDLVVDKKERDKLTDEFKLNNWVDVHLYSALLVNEFSNLLKIIDKDIDLIESKLEDAESKRQVLQQVIKQTSSNKNFFILASIISQILSLLSLLILFRNLIKNKL